MKVILLSGPPGCGKDEVGNYLQDACWARLYKFAEPMKDALKAMFGYSDEELEQAKRDHPEIRAAHIFLAEKVAKPIYGQAYFGVRCAQKVFADRPELAVVTDCGFQIEADAFVSYMPGVDIELWQIHRPGYTFDNDSREWVHLSIPGCKNVKIENTGSLKELKAEVFKKMFDFSSGGSENE